MSCLYFDPWPIYLRVSKLLSQWDNSNQLRPSSGIQLAIVRRQTFGSLIVVDDRLLIKRGLRAIQEKGKERNSLILKGFYENPNK